MTRACTEKQAFFGSFFPPFFLFLTCHFELAEGAGLYTVTMNGFFLKIFLFQLSFYTSFVYHFFGSLGCFFIL